ncbi:MAG: LysR family transcriptional regulator [Thermoleophilia bacterium]|nr:LysR family transcriptional regulator [Thermoleophilia bacterium]
MDVELRHMRALIAVAEELNFTRAAERLHLTQQALSGQIRQLEQRVGTRLVERDTHHVALTPSGVVLHERCRSLLTGAEQAVAAARATGEEPARLTIGYPAPLTHRIAAPAIELFTTRHPEVEITIHFGELLDPQGGLRGSAADVAIVYGALEHEGLDLHPLFSEPRGVALAAGHPLAEKESVTIAELIEEPIIDVPSADPASRDFWIAAKHRAGKPPRVGATVQTVDGIVEAIGAGLGVATAVPAVVEAMGAAAGVVYRPVVDLEPVQFWVARRAGDDRRPVLDFIAAAVDAGHDRDSPAPGAVG